MMFLACLFFFLNSAASIDEVFVRQTFSQKELSNSELLEYDLWDCFDPYGLSGLDPGSLRKMYISNRYIGYDSLKYKTPSCLDITEKQDVRFFLKQPTAYWILAKRKDHPKSPSVKSISAPSFYRFGNRLCFCAVCVGSDCKDSSVFSGIIAYCTNSGLYAHSARWDIGGYFGFFSILKSSDIPVDLNPRLAKNIENADDVKHVKGVEFFEYDSLNLIGSYRYKQRSFLYGYDDYFEYSLDSSNGDADSLRKNGATLILEIKDGKRFSLKQKYYKLAGSSSSWPKLSRYIFVNPLGGGAAYRWHDLQNERVIVDNVVAIDDVRVGIHEYHQSHFFRYLSPLSRRDSVCIGYQLNSESKDLQLLCLGKNQRSVEHKFRNITIKITKF